MQKLIKNSKHSAKKDAQKEGMNKLYTYTHIYVSLWLWDRDPVNE